MDKHIASEQISALIDGQLSAREESAVHAHLTQCPSCRDLCEELAEVTQIFQETPVAEPSPFLWQRISAEIAPMPAPVAGNWFSAWGFRRPMWAAAGLAIVLLSAIIFTAEYRSSQRAHLAQLARQEALDQIETIRLALNGQDPEISNPFRAVLTADLNPNPFSVKRLSAESNPFQPVVAR